MIAAMKPSCNDTRTCAVKGNAKRGESPASSDLLESKYSEFLSGTLVVGFSSLKRGLMLMAR